ncbi:MAG: hypothetical protein QWI36_04035 [Wolbachia endosymbiont of Tyrophagus putrescentiae]|nr:hypothetical protein [Wolbachia endosymbiont of Tyrophagus putrescentiae]
MAIEMSKKSSEFFLSLTKKAANFGQNYSASLNNSSISSGKKFISAFLLIPVIVPTAITASLVGCTYLFLNAVEVHNDDSKLSKAAKGTIKFLIYAAAFVVLVPCVILNIVISLVPFLIFSAINRNQQNTGTQNEKVIATSEECIEKEVSELGSGNHSNTGNQSTIEIISQENSLNQAVIVRNINGNNMQNSAMMMQMYEDDSRVIMRGLQIGDINNYRQESFALCFNMSCRIVENGIDFNCGGNMRTGQSQEEAFKELMQQNPQARTILHSNSNRPLQIEPHVSAIKKSDETINR